MTIIYMITRVAVRNGPTLKRLGNMPGFYATEETAKKALAKFRAADRDYIYEIEAHGIRH